MYDYHLCLAGMWQCCQVGGVWGLPLLGITSHPVSWLPAVPKHSVTAPIWRLAQLTVEWGKDSVRRWGLAWQLGRVPSSLLSLSLEYPGVLLFCRLWAMVSPSVWSYLFSFSWICLIISGPLEVTLVAFYIFSDFMLLGDLCSFEVLVVERWGWRCASVSNLDPLFSSLMCLIKTGHYGCESLPFYPRLWLPILRSFAATNGVCYMFFSLFSDYLYVVFIMLLCHILFHFFLNMSWHIPISVHEELPHFF